MHINELLHNVFEKSSAHIDKRIHKTLLLSAQVLAENRHLSIAGIGRVLPSKAKVKHKIKRIDRLYGNTKLQSKTMHYYRVIAECLIGQQEQPFIIVDWSGLTHCGKNHFLRASIPVGGRALPILDMPFEEKDYGSQHAHSQFLNLLKHIVPSNCKPIIITDAGFRCPWFKLVKALGWDFVGRVRHITQYKEMNSTKWYPVKSLYKQSQQKPSYILSGLLAKANPHYCHFYLYKEKKKNRVRKNLRGKKIQCSVSLKHAKRGCEPWLIVTSLEREDYTAQQVIALYRKRMQVEESIRDTKNKKNGLGLRHHRTHTLARLNVALLLGVIALFLLWIIGTAIKMQKQHYLYQANTTKSRNVLSNYIIGWQYLKSDGKHIKKRIFFLAIKMLAQHTMES